MKAKRIQKKLDLNKQTIAIIGKEEMAGVQAGDMPIFDFTPFASVVKACDTLKGCPKKYFTETC